MNEKEGLAELRRRQVDAGASSLGLYVKQLVREHLAYDDDDAMARLIDSVEQLRTALLQVASRQAEMIRQHDESAAADSAYQLKTIVQRQQLLLTTLLTCPSPMTQEQAETIVRETLGKTG